MIKQIITEKRRYANPNRSGELFQNAVQRIVGWALPTNL